MGTPNMLLVGITDCLKPYLECLTFQAFEQIIGNATFHEKINGRAFEFTTWKAHVCGPYSLDPQDRVRKVPVSRVLNVDTCGADSPQSIVHTDLLLRFTKNGGNNLQFYVMSTTYVPHSMGFVGKRPWGTKMSSTTCTVVDLWDKEGFTDLIPETFLKDDFWKDVETWIKKSREPRILSLSMLRDLKLKVRADRERRV
jgi:hypothetical protein